MRILIRQSSIDAAFAMRRRGMFLADCCPIQQEVVSLCKMDSKVQTGVENVLVNKLRYRLAYNAVVFARQFDMWADDKNGEKHVLPCSVDILELEFCEYLEK